MQLPLNDPNAARAEAGRPGVVPTAGALDQAQHNQAQFKNAFFFRVLAPSQAPSAELASRM